MKFTNLKNLVLASLALGVGFTSCSEEDEIATGAQIVIEGETARTAVTGDTIRISYDVIKGTEKLEEVEIMRGVTTVDKIEKDVKQGLEDQVFEYVTTLNDLNETISFTIRATDKLDQQVTETVTIDVDADFTVSFTETEENPHKTEWVAGETVTLNFTATAKNFDLTKVELYKGTELLETYPAREEGNYSFSYETEADAPSSTLDFTIKGFGKETEAATSDVEYPEAQTLSVSINEQLLETSDFTWKRIGNADATGLEAYGLTWTSNSTTNAIIKKGADKLVIVDDATKYAATTTATALKDLVDNGTDVTKFEGVSVTEDKAYDKVIATKKGDEYFLIHITNATVLSETSGTTITITGESKTKAAEEMQE